MSKTLIHLDEAVDSVWSVLREQDAAESAPQPTPVDSGLRGISVCVDPDVARQYGTLPYVTVEDIIDAPVLVHEYLLSYALKGWRCVSAWRMSHESPWGLTFYRGMTPDPAERDIVRVVI